MAAEMGVVVLPVTEPGVAATTVPYDVVSPYSNDADVFDVLAFTVPFNVAPLEVIAVAAVVTTVGGSGRVVKVMSLP